MNSYDNKTCNTFVSDMEAAGFAVEHYRGRYFWEGPAVRAKNFDEAQDVIRATKIKLQSDSMGHSSIWYPKQSGRLV